MIPWQPRDVRCAAKTSGRQYIDQGIDQDVDRNIDAGCVPIETHPQQQ